MSVSDLMQQMADAGAPFEAILVAVRALEAKDAEIEARRAGDRERKRRQRDKGRDSHGTVTGHSGDGHGQTPAPSSPPDPPNTPTPVSITPRGTRAREVFPKPDWADPDVWADLLTNRRKKNLPNTASAHRKLLADIDRLADDHWPPPRILEAAVSRGWGAIYAGCKDEDDGRNGATNRRVSAGRMGGPSTDPLLAMHATALAAISRDAGDHH